LNKVNEALKNVLVSINNEIKEVNENDYYTNEVKGAAITALTTAKDIVNAEMIKDHHDSDCATHNEPSEINGKCDCLLER